MSIKFVNRLKAAGTICFTAILSILTIPAYSTTPPDLPSGALCNEDNLNTDTGPVDIEVTWTPNTINTTWYSNGTAMTVDSAYQTCTYDAPLVPPTPSPRAGYTFGGWKIKRCEIPSIDVNTNGTSRGYITDITAYDGQYGVQSANTNDYNLIEDNTWGTTWSNGDKVTGVALCSAHAGNSNQGNYSALDIGNSSDWTSDENTLNSATGEKKYCWCRATHYTANNSSQCSLSSSTWLFQYEQSSDDYCKFTCALACGNSAKNNREFRAELFTGLVAQ